VFLRASEQWVVIIDRFPYGSGAFGRKKEERGGSEMPITSGIPDPLSRLSNSPTQDQSSDSGGNSLRGAVGVEWHGIKEMAGVGTERKLDRARYSAWKTTSKSSRLAVVKMMS
jgi:hypothetical protein